MNIVIIEDEALAAEKLTNYIGQYSNAAKVVTVLDSIKSALQWLQHNTIPDLIFSDIELLDGNAFKIFDSFSIACPVIFTTSYDQYLMDAFEVNGIEYLLKPFSFERFKGAMKKYERLKNNFAPLNAHFLDEIKRSIAQPEKAYKQRFAVKSSKGIYLVQTKEIALVQVANGVVMAYIKSGKRYPLNYSLNHLEEILDPTVFFRINRSEMVNINFIEKLEPYFNDRLSVKLSDFSDSYIASTNRTPELRKWIER